MTSKKAKEQIFGRARQGVAKSSIEKLPFLLLYQNKDEARHKGEDEIEVHGQASTPAIN